MPRVLILGRYRVEVVSAMSVVGKALFLVSFKAASCHVLRLKLAICLRWCVVLHVLFVRSLHLTVFALMVPLRHLVVADVVVDLVVDGLLHYVPVGVSLG